MNIKYNEIGGNVEMDKDHKAKKKTREKWMLVV